MILDTQTIAILILASIAAIAVVSWFFRKDDMIEERRRNMLKLYARLQELGLERLAGFAQAYIVGDYSSLYKEAHTLLHDIMDPVKADEMLAKVFYKQLVARWKDANEQLKIKSVIDAVK